MVFARKVAAAQTEDQLKEIRSAARGSAIFLISIWILFSVLTFLFMEPLIRLCVGRRLPKTIHNFPRKRTATLKRTSFLGTATLKKTSFLALVFVVFALRQTQETRVVLCRLPQNKL